MLGWHQIELSQNFITGRVWSQSQPRDEVNRLGMKLAELLEFLERDLAVQRSIHVIKTSFG